MRQIQFKGRKKGSTEWLEGDLNNIDGNWYVFPKYATNSPNYYEVDPETIGQLTPFVAMDGEKIWEGDMVKDYVIEIILEVVFTDYGNFGLRSPDASKDLEYETIDPAYTETTLIRVGNIHDLTPQVSKEGGEP